MTSRQPDISVNHGLSRRHGEQHVWVAWLQVADDAPDGPRLEQLEHLRRRSGGVLLQQQSGSSRNHRCGHGCAADAPGAAVCIVPSTEDRYTWCVDVVATPPVAEARTPVVAVRGAHTDGRWDEAIGHLASVHVVVGSANGDDDSGIDHTVD